MPNLRGGPQPRVSAWVWGRCLRSSAWSDRGPLSPSRPGTGSRGYLGGPGALRPSEPTSRTRTLQGVKLRVEDSSVGPRAPGNWEASARRPQGQRRSSGPDQQDDSPSQRRVPRGAGPREGAPRAGRVTLSGSRDSGPLTGCARPLLAAQPRIGQPGAPPCSRAPIGRGARPPARAR